MPLPENPTTKEKIFFAAIKVFAEKGFKEATVRDICKLADSANLNAVNYYYGGKAKLYECILEMMFAEELQHRWDNDELLQSDKASPHEKLMAYIRLHCALAYDEAEIVRDLNAIFIREMSRPSEFVKDLAKKQIRPQVEALMSILRGILGDNTPEYVLRDCLASIIGQITYYLFIWPIFHAVFPDHPGMQAYQEHLAKHIYRFASAGLKETKRALEAGEIPIQQPACFLKETP